MVSLMPTLEVLVGGALLAVLLHTLVNSMTMPRLTAVPGRIGGRPFVSVLIPARNEEATIERCLRGWCRQDYENYEILVYDDDSTDGTARIAMAVRAGERRVRILRGHGLPEGWRGKPHACHRLARNARGAVLLFADADVVAAPTVLAATVGALGRLDADALSAIPRHVGRRPAVGALVALQNWAVLAFVPSWLQRPVLGHIVVAMNGQFMAMPREVYETAGGFEAVRDALGEDVAFGRRLAHLGYRVRMLDGSALLRCEPYATLAEAWRANARNLLPVFFGSVPVLLLALALLGTMYIGPVVVLLLGGFATEPQWLGLPLAALALGVAGRWVADRRSGYPAWLALTHPLAAGALIGIGVTSVIWFRCRRAIEWRGRRYSVTKAA